MRNKFISTRQNDPTKILRERVIVNLQSNWIDAANMVNFTSMLALSAGKLIGRVYPNTSSHTIEDLIRQEIGAATEKGLKKSQEQQVFISESMALDWLEEENLHNQATDVLSTISEAIIADAYSVLGDTTEHINVIKLLALHAGVCIGLVNSGKARMKLLHQSFKWLDTGITLGRQVDRFKAVANS